MLAEATQGGFGEEAALSLGFEDCMTQKQRGPGRQETSVSTMEACSTQQALNVGVNPSSSPSLLLERNVQEVVRTDVC